MKKLHLDAVLGLIEQLGIDALGALGEGPERFSRARCADGAR
jgi:hypothetical protein